MDEIRNKVNESAEFYNRSILNLDYQLAEFCFRTLSSFFKGSAALELGPASGYMTKFLIKEFNTLHLIEGSEKLLDQIPNYPNVTKYHSLFEDFETGTMYDTIIMSHVLEHIADPVFVLRKIHRWLKDDGVLLISVPNAKSLHRLVAVEMGLLSNEYELNERDHELGHYRVYDPISLRQHASEAGFKVKDGGGYFLKPISNGQIEKSWSQEMIEGFFKVGTRFKDNCAEIFIVCSK